MTSERWLAGSGQVSSSGWYAEGAAPFTKGACSLLQNEAPGCGNLGCCWCLCTPVPDLLHLLHQEPSVRASSWPAHRAGWGPGALMPRTSPQPEKAGAGGKPSHFLAPRLFYFTSHIAPPPGLRPCHWQQSPAPYALLIASFPSLSHFPSPPVAYLDHLHTQPFTPQILVTGTASGEAETGSERGGVGLPGVRLCPKSWGPRYQARVRGGD